MDKGQPQYRCAWWGREQRDHDLDEQGAALPSPGVYAGQGGGVVWPQSGHPGLSGVRGGSSLASSGQADGRPGPDPAVQH